MKNALKLALVGATLSCAAVAGVTTATFAWLLKAEDSSLNYKNVLIEADTPYVTLEMAPLIPTGSSVSEFSGSQDYTSSAKIQAVSSSIGNEFYALNTDANAENPYRKLTSSEYEDYLVRFGLIVHVAPMATTKKLQAKVTFAVDGEQDVANWLRCSLLYANDDNFSPQPTMYTRVVEANPSGTGRLAYIDGVHANDIKTADSQKYATVDTYFDICDVKAAATHHFVVSFWMEGCLAENQNAGRGTIVGAGVTFHIAEAA